MRTAVESVYRGLDIALANWPLMLLRLAANFVIAFLAVAGIFAIAIPFISAGVMTAIAAQSEEKVEHAIETLLYRPWLLVYFVLALTIVTLMMMLLHSFVQAGVIGVYADAEAKVGDVSTRDRARFQVFSAEKWFAHARSRWWVTFLVYNIVWGVALLIVLVPLVAGTAGVWVLRESPAVLAAGCGVLVAAALLLVGSSIVASVWSQFAITVAVQRGVSAGESVREGWRRLKSRFANTVALVGILFLVSIGIFAALAIVYAFMGFLSMAPFASLVTFPIQMILSFAQSILSVVISCWFVAAVVSIAAAEPAVRLP